MNVDYINPFTTSLTNIFETMLGGHLERGQIQLKDSSTPAYDVSGVIGLSGKAVGTVVVSFSKEVALKSASAMLLMEATELDEDVIDAVGEITNMVAGGAKAELEEYQLSISLPNVITGKDHEIRFPSNITPIFVPFESTWGPLSIQVGFEFVAEPAAV